MPVVERRECAVEGKLRAIRSRDAGVWEIEAEKGEPKLGQHRGDLREREPVFLHAEREVAKPAHAVEILASCEPSKRRVRAMGQNELSERAHAVSSWREALSRHDLASAHDMSPRNLAVESDTHYATRK